MIMAIVVIGIVACGTTFADVGGHTSYSSSDSSSSSYEDSHPTSAKNPIKSYVCGAFSEAIGEVYGNVIDITKLQTNKRVIAKTLKEIVNEQLEENEWGIEVNAISIESIKLPQKVQERLNEASAVRVQGGFEAARAIAGMETMRNIGENSSGGAGMAGMFASAGLGMSMGRNIGNEFSRGMESGISSNLDAEAQARQQQRVNMYNDNNSNEKYSCSCGYKASSPFKFCPECGNAAVVQSEEKFCSNCGAKNDANAKFCPECGTKL